MFGVVPPNTGADSFVPVPTPFVAWLCECTWFYTGEGPATLFREPPPADQCHQMAECGWYEVSLTKVDLPE